MDDELLVFIQLIAVLVAFICSIVFAVKREKRRRESYYKHY